ncbi:MAG: alpha/beta hydrolase [Symploca sp. SIO2B6]|nr:alpha/beta hydrolase [Symploca sp. SIO2B6]
MIQCRNGTFKGARGINLFYQSWHPPREPYAILVIVHGLGAHSGLFGNVVEYLVPRNYTIYGFDLRGHGRSSGQRGYISSWADFREDLKAFLKMIEQKELCSRRFVLGHSMGGVIALEYLIRTRAPERGVITLAPALGTVGVSPLRLNLGKILSRLYPRFTLNTGIDLSSSSRDPEVVTAYAQDPLRHRKGTARLVTEFFATVDWVHLHADGLQIPLLILQGGADKVTLPSGSRTFFEEVTFPDKEKREYPQAYHEIHNDFNYQQMLADLEDWLERHLVPADSNNTPIAS